MNLDEILDKVIDFASVYGIKVIGAILIWIIGSWAIKKIMKATISKIKIDTIKTQSYF